MDTSENFKLTVEPAREAEFLQCMAVLYRELDADILARKPRCIASGRCCKFEEYGHRLYVTHAELIFFRSVEMVSPYVGNAKSLPLPLYTANGEFARGCPWQVGGLCTAREGRPLGCRVYFCDPDSLEWQSDLYERWHRRLVNIHEAFHIPYGYVEWRQGLALASMNLQVSESGVAGEHTSEGNL